MIRIALLLSAVSLCAVPGIADAATTSGANALALAALVARQSPGLGVAQKAEMARLLDGGHQIVTGAGGPIHPSATKILCRYGDVDIAARSCTLTFATRTVTLTGRQANELTATMAANGIESSGAAGTISFGVSELSCTIAPTLIRQEDGSGALCTFGSY